MYNDSIVGRKFNLLQTQLNKKNQQKAEEKPNEVIEKKVEAQNQQVEQPKMSSAEVLSRLAEMQKDAVVNTPKTQAPENVAPKKNAEKTEVDRTVEEYVDENGLIVRTTTIIYDDGSKSVITQKITTQGFDTLIESLCFSQQVEEYDNEGNLISKNNVLPYPFDMGDGATFEIDGRQYSVSLTQGANGKFIGILDNGYYRYEVKFDEKYRMVGVELTYKANYTRNHHTCSMFDENGREIVSSHGGRCLPGDDEFPSNPEKMEENFYKLIEKFNLPKELLNLDIYNEDSGYLFEFTVTHDTYGKIRICADDGDSVSVQFGGIWYRVSPNGTMEVIESVYDENGKKTDVKTKYIYDEQGRVIREEKSEVDNDWNELENIYTIDYTYDDKGRITKEEKTETDVDGNVTKTTTEYSYNFLGTEKTITVENPDGTKSVTEEKQDRKGKVTSKVTYYYDKDGNLVDTVVEVEDKTKINPNNIKIEPIMIDFSKLEQNEKFMR